MSLLSGVGEFFGLDIGTSAVRIVQLHGNGAVKALVRYAYVPVDNKIILSDAKADQQKLAQIIGDLLAQSKISARNVAVGLPSQRVFNTVVDIDRLSPAELAKSIRYQADTIIPTPLDESKLDWAILGDSPKDKTKIEVLISSATNNYIEARMDMLESIGLNVIAFEPDGLALVRALTTASNTNPTVLIDMGNITTDLVIVMNGAPRLIRSIANGTDTILHTAMQHLNIDDKQAEQFIFKFGLAKNKLEGQIYQAIIGTVDMLMGEVDKSINFFTSRYQGAKIERIIVTGGAATLPEFPLYMANKLGMNVEIGNAWRNVTFSPSRQNDLLAVSSHFGVAVGLAERQE